MRYRLTARLRAALATLGASLLIAAAVAACGGDETEEVVTSDVEWGYTGDGGPDNWASLSSDNAACGAGGMQSPIDITGYSQTNLNPPISFSLRREATEIDNDGKRLEVTFRSGNRVGFAERTYQLPRVVYRSPSEHSLDGEAFAVELQLMLEQTFGDLAVASFLYRIGAPDPYLAALLEAAPAAGETNTDADGMSWPGLNARELIPTDLGYYKYVGSLTTPPCTEPVDWFIMNEIGTVSQDQVNQLRALVDAPNNRPIRPGGGREINYSGPR